MKFFVIVAVFSMAYADPETAMENVTPFDSVDTDGNGGIDYNEFEKWHKTKLGEKSESKIKGIFAQYDVSHDQTLDVSEFVPLAYEVSRKPVDTAEQIFKRMDLNNDHIVDLNEANTARKEYDASIIDGVLAVADVNNDGQLTYEEFTAHLNYNKPKTRKEIEKEMAYQILNYIDVDRDGKLSQEEIFSFASVYNKLSKEEIADVVATLDVNKDGFLTVGELERIPGKMSQLANIQPPPTV
ncbi:EF hand [Necator americanus]|uniref:EF hand n=1 Tax=Necator americanus TaxID=51031 RepID=W2TKU6_NECAM|nr:EF hand [Necator americanus]ETN82408.1 EF hand [Necator americanus]